MSEIISMISLSEKLTITGFLFGAVLLLAYILYYVYRDKKDCYEARILDANERSNMNKELGEFKGRLGMLEKLYHDHRIKD